ncbi:MAG TPA: response regulator [Candidatus Synoicihabitans sp.]|nr:response regulator [Candidatus Synoicihabitans sp.]
MSKILIVEDEALIAQLISTALSAHGYECLWVRDGVEALAKLTEFEPAIVLTDLVMSGMGGLQLIPKLRAAMPELRIVAMTGCQAAGPEAPLAAAQRLGADAVLAKPFRVLELLEALAPSEPAPPVEVVAANEVLLSEAPPRSLTMASALTRLVRRFV